MPPDLIIRHAHLVTPDAVLRADLAITAGQISEISPTISARAKEEIDATGLHVFPGVIDPHVHFNEPGRTDWEGFATGSAALAAGGGTCFFDMPLNSSPPVLDGATFDAKRAAAEQNSLTDFALWGGLTPDNLDHLEELAARGVIGFKAFMSDSGIDEFPRADDATLRAGMRIAARLGLPVAVHAEDEEMTARLAAEARAAGRTSYRDYVRTRPVEAEVAAIRSAVAIAKETGCSLHVVHVSSIEGVKALLDQGNHDISSETCPHYFTFTEDDLYEQGAALKCAPPLRDRESAAWIAKTLALPTVTMIGSDHSPAPASMKTSDNAFEVWGGIAGVQSTLSATLTAATNCPLHFLARMMSTYAAHRFRLPNKGKIAIGHDADLALVDLAATYTLTRDMLLDRHKQSPYVSRTFRGQVRRTLVRGHTIFQDGHVTAGNFRGRLITPAPRDVSHA